MFLFENKKLRLPERRALPSYLNIFTGGADGQRSPVDVSPKVCEGPWVSFFCTKSVVDDAKDATGSVQMDTAYIVSHIDAFLQLVSGIAFDARKQIIIFAIICLCLVLLLLYDSISRSLSLSIYTHAHTYGRQVLLSDNMTWSTRYFLIRTRCFTSSICRLLSRPLVVMFILKHIEVFLVHKCGFFK